MPPRSYRNFAEFEREYLKPAFRVGQTFEDLIEDSPFDAEFEFDRDLLEEESDDDDA
ncbi:MAG: transcriptional regulator [Deltaproteobacteria bacterium]|nr:transcriptional regulator [Deltaproteobacteria bacterium]